MTGFVPKDTEWNGVRVIDASAEVVTVRDTPDSPLRWLGGEIVDSDWKVELSQEAVDAIMQLAEELDEETASRDLRWFRESAAVAAAKAVRQKTDAGPGFAVMHGFPIEHMDANVALEIYQRLGNEIAPSVAQKFNGEMIYSIRDTGQTYGYGVRGSRTSVELVFHVDNAFGIVVPDYVGLLCEQPAKQGGISRFCSLYTVHERLKTRFPEALKRLYQPMLFDRQKEHHETAAKVLLAPFFSWRNDRLFARANVSLVRKGYQVAEMQMEPQLEDALAAVTEVCADQRLWCEAPLDRGHIQYLNNHEIAHYRSEFVDYEEPARKRHLHRLWHRNRGSQHYDGLSL